ncbi:hypothetical protein R6Q59_017101 [Mikania micrantha]
MVNPDSAVRVPIRGGYRSFVGDGSRRMTLSIAEPFRAEFELFRGSLLPNQTQLPLTDKRSARPLLGADMDQVLFELFQPLPTSSPISALRPNSSTAILAVATPLYRPSRRRRNSPPSCLHLKPSPEPTADCFSSTAIVTVPTSWSFDGTLGFLLAAVRVCSTSLPPP